MPSAQSNIIRITCAPGLSRISSRRWPLWAIAVESKQETAVEITGTQSDAMKLNLYLRTANHVLCC